MKKVMAMLLVGAMVLSLCACGAENKTTEKTAAARKDATSYVLSEDTASYEPGTLDKKDGDYMVDASGAEVAEMDKGAVCSISTFVETGNTLYVPVTIYNQTDKNLMYVYIAAEDDPSWGPDLLGDSYILNYSYETINMFIYGCASNYNVGLIFDDGTKYAYPAVPMGNMNTCGFSILISQEMGMRLFLED